MRLRLGRFEEAIAIIATLLREGRVDFLGKYYQARECELRPRGPRPHGPPILVGTSRPRMLQLTARFADSWNAEWKRPDELPALLAAVDAACREAGRDPATLERTAAVRVGLPGAVPRPLGGTAQISGPPDELAAPLRAYADAGITHLQIWLNPNSVAGIEAFAPVLQLLDQG